MSRTDIPRLRYCGDTGGFSLLEVLIVLLIIGTVTSLVPQATWRDTDKARVHSAARLLAADLRWSRQHAISRGVEADLVLDRIRMTYARAGDGIQRQLPPFVQLVTGRPDVAREEASSSYVVRFFPDGTSNGARIDLIFGTRIYSVGVSHPFGRVELRS